MNEDKILQMFFDIGQWTKAIEKGVLKDIRKDQLIRLTDEHTRMAMAYAMRRGKYEISPPHTAQIPKDNGEFRTVYVNEPMDRRSTGYRQRPALRVDAGDAALFVQVLPDRYRVRQGSYGSQPPDDRNRQ